MCIATSKIHAMSSRDEVAPNPGSQPQPAPESLEPPSSISSPPSPSTDVSSAQQADRTELLSRARSFLTSPQIEHHDVLSKHRFLTEKGLTDQEVDGLLREFVH